MHPPFSQSVNGAILVIDRIGQCDASTVSKTDWHPQPERNMVNERFFALPPERQRDILNAAFKVFANSDYKHASMQQIADEAHISKALLFHYFKNKQELYLHLWNVAAQLTARTTREFGALETTDFFEMLRRTTRAKCAVMREHPHSFGFAIRAYYEQDPAVRAAIHRDVDAYADRGEELVAQLVDSSTLRDDVTAEEVYRQFVLLTDGYMFQKNQADAIDADAIEADFEKIIDHWQRVYSKSAVARPGEIKTQSKQPSTETKEARA